MEAARIRSTNHQAQSQAVVTKAISNCQHMASDSGALVQASKTKQDIREALVIINIIKSLQLVLTIKQTVFTTCYVGYLLKEGIK